MLESPTAHAQVFAGFGHQSSIDASSTIRRQQTSTRLSVMANAKRIYDEVNPSSTISFAHVLFVFFRH